MSELQKESLQQKNREGKIYHQNYVTKDVYSGILKHYSAKKCFYITIISLIVLLVLCLIIMLIAHTLYLPHVPTPRTIALKNGDVVFIQKFNPFYASQATINDDNTTHLTRMPCESNSNLSPQSNENTDYIPSGGTFEFPNKDESNQTVVHWMPCKQLSTYKVSHTCSGKFTNIEEDTNYPLYARNLGEGSKVRFNFKFEHITDPPRSVSKCVATVLVFNDIKEYELYLTKGATKNNFTSHCIGKKTKELKMTLFNIKVPGYYFVSMNISLTTSVKSFEFTTTATEIHYNISESVNTLKVLRNSLDISFKDPQPLLPSDNICVLGWYASSQQDTQDEMFQTFKRLNFTTDGNLYVVRVYISLTLIATIGILTTLTVVFTMCILKVYNTGKKVVSKI